MLLQVLQILALGSNKVFEFFNIEFHKLIGLNLISFFNLESSKFWKIIDIYLYLKYLYIFFFLITIKTKQTIFQSHYFLSKLKDLIDIFLPLIGHFLFIPLISSLLNIFSCSNAIGDYLENSYLDRDCNVFCYKGIHLTYSYICSIGLFFYIIISVLNRPYWDIQQVSLNIRTKTEYYSIQSIFQITVVIINAIFETNQIKYVGFAISINVFIFLLLTFAIKPYNYERGVMIQKVFLVLAFWCFLLQSVFVYAENKIAFASIYFAGIWLFWGLELFCLEKWMMFLRTRIR